MLSVNRRTGLSQHPRRRKSDNENRARSSTIIIRGRTRPRRPETPPPRDTTNPIHRTSLGFSLSPAVATSGWIKKIDKKLVVVALSLRFAVSKHINRCWRGSVETLRARTSFFFVFRLKGSRVLADIGFRCFSRGIIFHSPSGLERSDGTEEDKLFEAGSREVPKGSLDIHTRARRS